MAGVKRSIENLASAPRHVMILFYGVRTYRKRKLTRRDEDLPVYFLYVHHAQRVSSTYTARSA
jgi:hypothetical protein